MKILGSHVEPILVPGTHIQPPSDLGDGQVFVRQQEEVGIVNFKKYLVPGNQGYDGELLTVDDVVRCCECRIVKRDYSFRDPVICNVLLYVI